jgi:DNA-binding MarR family transcriptional regulator
MEAYWRGEAVALGPLRGRAGMETVETGENIAELINELALLGVRSLTRRKRILETKQRLRLVGPFMSFFLKEGRPGFLFVVDIARSLDVKGELTISEVAEITGRPLATVSRFVEALEDGGMVRRTQNPEDGRSKLVGLTEAGQKLVSDLRAEARAPLMEKLQKLTPAERRTLERLLGKLAAPEAALPAVAPWQGRAGPPPRASPSSCGGSSRTTPQLPAPSAPSRPWTWRCGPENSWPSSAGRVPGSPRCST